MLIYLSFNVWLSDVLLTRFAHEQHKHLFLLVLGSLHNPCSIFHCSSRAGCYAGRHWGCSLRLQGTAPLGCTDQCKVKANCSFIYQLSFLRKWDLNKLYLWVFISISPHTPSNDFEQADMFQTSWTEKEKSQKYYKLHILWKFMPGWEEKAN